MPQPPRIPRLTADLRAGDHVCLLYETEEEHRAAVVPFLRIGLARHERVLYLRDAHEAEALLGYLRDDGLDPDPLVAAGQLVVMGSDQSYLRLGAFTPDAMLQFLRSEMDRAVSDGFAALRVTGEMTWALRSQTDAADLIRYEVRLNELLPGSRGLAFCQYDRRRFTPELLLEVLRSHQSVAIGPDVCSSPHYVPPAAFYAPDRQGAELTAWIDSMIDSRQREDALGDARVRVENIIDATRAGTWEFNTQTGVAVVNERWAEIVGYTLEELEELEGGAVGAWATLTHPDDRARADALQARHLSGEIPDYRAKVRMRHKDGRWIWVETRGRLVSRTSDGQPLRMLGTHVDVTEQEAAEEELRAAHVRLQWFIDANIVGILIARTDGAVVLANDYYLDLIGYTREEFERGEVDWRAVTPPEWIAVDEQALRELAEQGVCAPYEKEYVRRDGRRVFVLLADTLIPGDEGEIAAFAIDISDRKAAEEALRQSRALLKAVIDSTTDAIYAKDREGRYTLFNASSEAVTGRQSTDVLGHDDTFLFPPDEAAVVMDADRAAMEEDAPSTYEERVTTASGRVHTFLSTKGPLRDANGAVIGLFGSAHDITRRKEAEDQLSAQAMVLEILGDQGPVQATLDRVVTALAERLGLRAVGIRLAEGEEFPFAAATGYSDAFLRTENLLAIRDADGRVLRNEDGTAQLACTCGLVLSGTPNTLGTAAGSIWTNESRPILDLPRDQDPRLNPRNRCFHVGFESVAMVPLRAGDRIHGLLHFADTRKGRFTASAIDVFEGIGTSIAAWLEHRAAEQALGRSEAWRRTVLETAMDGFWLLSDDGRLLEVNDAYCAMSGYTTDELLAMRVADLEAIETQASVAARIRHVHEAGGNRFETRHRRKDGTEFDVEVSLRPARDNRIATFLRDVTDRKAAEAALRQRTAELEEAQRVAHVGNWAWDPATGAATWSDEMFRVFGLEIGRSGPSAAELVAIHDADTHAQVADALARTARTGVGYEIEYAIVRPDGADRHVVERGEAVRDDAGAIVSLRGTLSDVTDLHRAQALADQAQRAEMVGRLAGGVAHDFNNLLTAIGGYAELLTTSIDPDDPRRDDVAAIRVATTRAATLTRQLLAFGRREILRPTVVSVGEVIAGLTSMLRSVIPADIAIVVRHDEAAGRVLVDRAHLEHAIVNLALNARDAMAGSVGGTLTIETDAVVIEDGDPRLRPPASPGDYVRLTVTDTGAGIPADILPHLFEPFFTTKPFGQGSGLGLSSVEGFVAMSGGFLGVDTRPGSGSTFSIFLARTPEAGGPAGDGTGLARERILLVDDEPEVRRVTARILRGLGYEVVEAGDAAEALAMDDIGPAANLLLTDMVMPGMDGRGLARRWSARHPGMPMLFISGYAQDSLPSDGYPDVQGPILAKPFTVEALAAHLRALLDESGAGA